MLQFAFQSFLIAAEKLNLGLVVAVAAVIGILYNFQLLKYAGENGVASYGVLMYIQFVFAAIFIGYSMGCAPVMVYGLKILLLTINYPYLCIEFS